MICILDNVIDKINPNRKKSVTHDETLNLNISNLKHVLLAVCYFMQLILLLNSFIQWKTPKMGKMSIKKGPRAADMFVSESSLQLVVLTFEILFYFFVNLLEISFNLLPVLTVGIYKCPVRPFVCLFICPTVCHSFSFHTFFSLWVEKFKWNLLCLFTVSEYRTG